MLYKNHFTRFGLILGVMLALLNSNGASAQIYGTNKGEIFIVGTANTRSWTLNARELDCKADLSMIDDKIVNIRSLTFTIQVEDLKGQNVWINRGVYKALKGYPFDKIHYKGVYFKTSMPAENSYVITTEGNLSIAGVTKIMSLSVKASILPDGKILCTGSTAIKMSDYGVHLHPVEQKRLDIGDEVILTFAIELAKQ